MEKRYKLRDGIAQANVCGVHLLVPLNTLWEENLSIKRIPKGLSLALAFYAKNTSEQAIIDLLALFGRTTNKEMVKKNLYEALDTLCNAGYIETVE